MSDEKYSEEDVIEFLKKIDIDMMGLSERIVPILKENRISTLYDLTETDIYCFKCSIPGFGYKSQQEVLTKLEELGLSLRRDHDGPYSNLFLPEKDRNCNKSYEEADVAKILDMIMEREKT